MKVNLKWLAQQICFAITHANHQAKRQERAKRGDASVNDFEVGKIIAFFDILNAGGADVRLWGTEYIGDNCEFQRINSIWVNGKIITVEKDIFWQSKFISQLQEALKKRY